MNRVPLEKKVLSENDRLAAELRQRFSEMSEGTSMRAKLDLYAKLDL